MRKLLMLQLRSTCAAEARLNGMVVARLRAGGGTTGLAVHEYVIEGKNDLVLAIEPLAAGVKPAPRQARDPMSASIRLMLVPFGESGASPGTRSITELSWGIAANEVYAQGIERRSMVMLPVKFPRWRWLDLSPQTPSQVSTGRIAEFLTSLALSLTKGDADPFIAAAQVRFEDLATAYRQTLPAIVDAWRSRLASLHEAGQLRPVFPLVDALVLAPCAGGRLFECLGPGGEPALRTEPSANGRRYAWPVRVAIARDRCVIVR